MTPRVIAFSGHRDRVTDPERLLDLLREFPEARLVHGGAAGFDSQVEAVARAEGRSPHIRYPDYARFEGRIAPLRRNLEILAEADLLIVCFDGRRNGGTWRTIQVAELTGIPVRFLPPKE